MLTISCLLTFLIVFPVEGLVLPDRGSSQRLSTWSSHLAMATQSPEVMKIESLKRDDEEIEVEEIVVRVSKPQVVRSQALPFLVCPAPLVDCDYAGNVGFDPLGFAKDSELLAQYREAEIKHSRLAMLAAAGWPLSELFDRKIATLFGATPVLDSSDRAPSILNGGMEKISPVWWGCCLGLTAAIDLYSVSKSRKGDPNYFPGKLDFDPLGLYPSDQEGQKRMQLAEIKHGRLAMVAILGYVVQEYVTKIGVVDETPVFFEPITESVQALL